MIDTPISHSCDRCNRPTCGHDWCHESWRSSSWKHFSINCSPVCHSHEHIKIFCVGSSFNFYIYIYIYIYIFHPSLWHDQWSSLPSNTVAQVRLLVGSEILISILGLGVCPLCSSFSPAVALTLHWPHIQGGLPLFYCLMFWSTVCCSPSRYLTHRHWVVSLGGVSPTLGEGK